MRIYYNGLYNMTSACITEKGSSMTAGSKTSSGAPRPRWSGLAALGARERRFATLLWRKGELARSEIHQVTGVHPTLTGNSVATLIGAGLLRDGRPRPTPERGRPQVPVMIDPDQRLFLGLSLSPGEVRLARIDPTGKRRGDEIVQPLRERTKELRDFEQLFDEVVILR